MAIQTVGVTVTAKTATTESIEIIEIKTPTIGASGTKIPANFYVFRIDTRGDGTSRAGSEMTGHMSREKLKMKNDR